MATHVTMEVSKYGPFVNAEIDGLRRTKGIKLVLISMEKKDFWETLASDLYVLSQYVDCLTLWLVTPLNERTPLPYKPRLLSLPTIRAMMIRYNEIFLPRKRRRRAKQSR
jgi:hypothetical protein